MGFGYFLFVASIKYTLIVPIHNMCINIVGQLKKSQGVMRHPIPLHPSPTYNRATVPARISEAHVHYYITIILLGMRINACEIWICTAGRRGAAKTGRHSILLLCIILKLLLWRSHVWEGMWVATYYYGNLVYEQLRAARNWPRIVVTDRFSSDHCDLYSIENNFRTAYLMILLFIKW